MGEFLRQLPQVSDNNLQRFQEPLPLVFRLEESPHSLHYLDLLCKGCANVACSQLSRSKQVAGRHLSTMHAQ
jgi:hypothetical protein